MGSIPTASTIYIKSYNFKMFVLCGLNLTFPIDNSKIRAMALLATEVHDERLLSAFKMVVEHGTVSDTTDGGHDFCPRCALVLKPGQLTTHLSACSGVT